MVSLSVSSVYNSRLLYPKHISFCLFLILIRFLFHFFSCCVYDSMIVIYKIPTILHPVSHALKMLIFILSFAYFQFPNFSTVSWHFISRFWSCLCCLTIKQHELQVISSSRFNVIWKLWTIMIILRISLIMMITHVDFLCFLYGDVI